MKKRKILLGLISLNLTLFSCSKTNSIPRLNDEVESIQVIADKLYVGVGDVVDVASLIQYTNDVKVSFTIELTKNSLSNAIISEQNNHLIEFVNPGKVIAKIITADKKTATLNFEVFSKKKSQFMNHISKIDKKYAFIRLETNNDKLTQKFYQVVHNENYTFFYSGNSKITKTYSGYLKDGSNEKTYKFEMDGLNGTGLQVLPSDTGSSLDDYIFSTAYSMDPDLVSTITNDDGSESLYVDLSSDVSLATKYLRGPMMLIDQRKSRIGGTDFYNTIQGDHIVIDFKDVEFQDFQGNTVTKNVPVYTVYNRIYNFLQEQYDIAGNYALISDEIDLTSQGVEKYISDKEVPEKLNDNTLSEIVKSLLPLRNYSLTIQGLWYDNSGRQLPNSLVPQSGSKNLFDNFQSTISYSDSKIEEVIDYGYSTKPKYVYTKTTGENKYQGSYNENNQEIQMTFYYSENDKSFKLEIANKATGTTKSQNVTKELIDSTSYYITYKDTTNVKFKFVENKKMGTIDIYKESNKLTTLNYIGNGIKISTNVKEDETIGIDLIDAGYVLKNGDIDTNNDVLLYKNTLNDLYVEFDDSIDMQKVVDYTATDSSTGKTKRTIDIQFAKPDSTLKMFEKLVRNYPVTGNSLATYLTKTNKNIYNQEFTYASFFQPEIIVEYADENDTIPTRIIVDYVFTYSSLDSIYYHIGFEFSKFNGVK